MPIAFFCRAKPQGCDAFAIFEQAARVFIGHPLLGFGREYDRNNLQHCLVDLTVDDEEWAHERAVNPQFTPQHTKNRNLVQKVTCGSIVVIPRPREGVVYVARITGDYDIVNAPGWAKDYLTLRETQGLDAHNDDENHHIADVAQGWPIDEYRQIDLTQLPGWMLRTMLGRTTYGVFGRHPVDRNITAYAVLESIVDGEHHPVPWTLDLDDIKRRLVDTLFPYAFECLVVSLLQLEHPHEIWRHVGGTGDGGVDGIGSDEEGNLVGLMQAKLYARHAPNFGDAGPYNPGVRLYSAVLTPERPEPPGGGVHFLDLNWIAKAVQQHWEFLPQARAMRIGEPAG